MTQKIIGLCGFISSGKDTVADYLTANHGFVRDSFAASLKEAVAKIFGWDIDMLNGLTAEARAKRDVVDEWWSARLKIPNLTPRWVLQNFGTNVCREHFHQDIWLATLENRLRAQTKPVVVTDCRFQNEVATLKKLGATVAWVRRERLPAWFKVAELAASGDEAAIQLMLDQEVHRSEWDWVNTDFDVIIPNYTTIQALHTQVEKMIKS